LNSRSGPQVTKALKIASGEVPWNKPPALETKVVHSADCNPGRMIPRNPGNIIATKIEDNWDSVTLENNDSAVMSIPEYARYKESGFMTVVIVSKLMRA